MVLQNEVLNRKWSKLVYRYGGLASLPDLLFAPQKTMKLSRETHRAATVVLCRAMKYVPKYKTVLMSRFWPQLRAAHTEQLYLESNALIVSHVVLQSTNLSDEAKVQVMLEVVSALAGFLCVLHRDKFTQIPYIVSNRRSWR